jgi:hypothetical protein
MNRENKRRDRILAENKEALKAPSAEQRQKLGDRHINYKYVL